MLWPSPSTPRQQQQTVCGGRRRFHSIPPHTFSTLRIPHDQLQIDKRRHNDGAFQRTTERWSRVESRATRARQRGKATTVQRIGYKFTRCWDWMEVLHGKYPYPGQVRYVVPTFFSPHHQQQQKCSTEMVKLTIRCKWLRGSKRMIMRDKKRNLCALLLSDP